MPDFFNSNDNGHTPPGAPQDWSGAFASLPLESPSADGWPRLMQALDRRQRRHHRAHGERRTTWVIGLASAAVLAIAAWSPLSHWLQDAPASKAPAPAALSAAPGSRGLAAPLRSPDATPDTAGETASKSTATSTSRATSKTRQMAHAGANVPRKASATAAQPTQAQSQEAAPASSESIAATASVSAVEALQAQSSHLEALVAIARDDRVGNASSELLSAELDASIAAVDASLADEDLEDSQRQELWQQRVDLLQQLAGIESTARWLAAQGMSNETALVSVD